MKNTNIKIHKILKMSEYELWNNKTFVKVTYSILLYLSDDGVIVLTERQAELVVLELRKLPGLTGKGLTKVASPKLEKVDLRGCSNITSDGKISVNTLLIHVEIAWIYIMMFIKWT